VILYRENVFTNYCLATIEDREREEESDSIPRERVYKTLPCNDRGYRERERERE
jgi:hypothetical protein